MNRHAFRTLTRARARGPSLVEFDTASLSPYFLQTQAAPFSTSSAYFSEDNPFDKGPNKPTGGQAASLQRERAQRSVNAVQQLAKTRHGPTRLRDRSTVETAPGDRAPRVVDIRKMDIGGGFRGRGGGLRGRGGAARGGAARGGTARGGGPAADFNYDRDDGLHFAPTSQNAARLSRFRNTGDGARGGGGFRGGDRGGFRGGDRGAFRGGDRGSFRGGDRGGFRGSDRGGARGASSRGMLRGRGAGRGAGGRGRGARGAGARGGKRRSPDDEDPFGDKKNKRNIDPLDVEEPDQKMFEDAVRFGTETQYNPKLGMEELKLHMPNVPGQSVANVHHSLATLGTADHIGLSGELTPQMFAKDLRKHGLRYFADLEEKKRTDAYLRKTKPFNKAEKGTAAIQPAEEAVRKSVLDAAVAGKMEAPKFTEAGKDPVQMSRNWHLRAETWGSKETRMFEEKLNSLLAKGKKAAAPKKP